MISLVRHNNYAELQRLMADCRALTEPAEAHGSLAGALCASEGYRLDLLMPDDDEPLELRAAALTSWCNGFVYGLGTGGAADPERLPGDAGEIVRDLAEITRAGVDEREGEEANEAALAELVEFVRVGVQVVFEELGALRAPPESRAEPRRIH